jgi:AcrR family transcriptional regulator
VPGRRAYSSALRDQHAGLTRRRVLDAALELFLAEGYLGATIEAVARRAEVSTQTVYNAVGGKAALLRAVYDVTLAGDDQPVPIAERPAFQAMLAETDGRWCSGCCRRRRRATPTCAPSPTPSSASGRPAPPWSPPTWPSGSACVPA